MCAHLIEQHVFCVEVCNERVCHGHCQQRCKHSALGRGRRHQRRKQSALCGGSHPWGTTKLLRNCMLGNVGRFCKQFQCRGALYFAQQEETMAARCVFQCTPPPPPLLGRFPKETSRWCSIGLLNVASVTYLNVLLEAEESLDSLLRNM